MYPSPPSSLLTFYSKSHFYRFSATTQNKEENASTQTNMTKEIMPK